MICRVSLLKSDGARHTRNRRQREGRRVGEDCSRGARHPRGGMAELLRSDGSAGDTPPTIARQPQAGDLGEEVGGGAPVGWRSDPQDEIPDVKKPEARQHGSWEHQEARLAVLPAQDRALSVRAVPQLDAEPAHPAMSVMPVPKPDSGAPLQGVSGVEGSAEDPVSGGAEGDWEVEGQMKDPGPPGGREVWAGGTGLPLRHGCGKAGASRGARSERGVGGGGAGMVGGAGGGGRGAGRPGTPLFLPTPDFMASTGEG